jgi:hypothetical protein
VRNAVDTAVKAMTGWYMVVYSTLRDEHLADELHPNEAGARIIAAEVFTVLAAVCKGGMKC